MKTTPIHLSAGQQLGNANISLTEQHTHIEGPTGIGKTTWLINELASQNRLVLVVPTLSQLRQLDSQYGKRPTLAFVSGRKKQALQDPDFAQKTVICTYDMLHIVREKLGGEETRQRVLVIDEAHKIYQAGGYRGTAIHNLLINFGKNMQWSRLLTVSATFSSYFVKLAKLAPQEWIKVTQAGRPVRQFEACYYAKEDFSLWANEILLLAKQPGRQGTIIVRVNSKGSIENLYHTYTAAGLKCQRVYADIQDEEEMRDLLKRQHIKAGMDVLLTTSLIDEAINIQNAQGSVHSIHIIGARTHVEEITQFVGRLRKANPPVFLHLSADKVIGYDHELPRDVSVDEFERVLYEALTEEYDECVNTASSLKGLLTAKRARDVATLKMRVMEMNASHRRCFDFAPLRFREAESVEKCKIWVNIGSMLAMTYRAEAENTYGLFEFLARELQKAIPGCTVTRKTVAPESKTDAVKDLFANGEAIAAEEMKQAKNDVGRRLRGYLRDRNIADLSEAASVFVDQFGTNTVRGRICQDYADVLKVVTDFDQAQRIIWRDEKSRVLKAYDALNDLIVKHLHVLIKEKGIPLRLDGKAACELVRAAARLAVKDDPSLKKSFDMKRGQRSGIRTKANNHIDVSSRDALAIIRENTCTLASSDEAAEERKRGKVIVSGLFYGGYNFKGFNDKIASGTLDEEFANDSQYAPSVTPDERGDEAA